MEITFLANILEAVFARAETQPQHYRASTPGSFSPPTLRTPPSQPRVSAPLSCSGLLVIARLI